MCTAVPELAIRMADPNNMAETSCVCGDTICLQLHPLQVDNIFIFIRQVVVLFRHNSKTSYLFARAQVAPVPAYWLFKTSATS